MTEKEIIERKRRGKTKLTYYDLSAITGKRVDEIRDILEREMVRLKQEEHKTNAQIAEATGCGLQTVHNALKKYECIKRRGKYQDDPDREERDRLICRMTKEGCTVAEIKEEIEKKWGKQKKWGNRKKQGSISDDTIDRILKENHIDKSTILNKTEREILDMIRQGKSREYIRNQLEVQDYAFTRLSRKFPEDLNAAQNAWMREKERRRKVWGNLSKGTRNNPFSAQKKQMILKYSEEGIATADIAYILNVSKTYCNNVLRAIRKNESEK